MYSFVFLMFLIRGHLVYQFINRKNNDLAFVDDDDFEINHSITLELLTNIYFVNILWDRTRPFPSCLLPLCQNECETIQIMCSSYGFIFMQIKPLFHIKGLHGTRFETEVRSSSEMAYLYALNSGSKSSSMGSKRSAQEVLVLCS